MTRRLIDIVNGGATPPTPPATLAELEAREAEERERDPDRCTLHELRVVLRPLDRSKVEDELLGGDEGRAESAAERAAELARARYDDEREGVVARHHDADAHTQRVITWQCSPVGRFIDAVTGGDSPSLDERYAHTTPIPPRWRWWCPCCQRDAIDAIHNGDDAAELLPEQQREQRLVVAHQHGRAGANAAVHARCLAGCPSEQLAAAIQETITRIETAAEASNRAALEAIAAEARAAELTKYSLARLATVAAPQWLIDGLVPDRSLVLLGGDGGSRKTWLAIEWALCLAAGVPFLGRACKRTRVYLVLLESTDEDHAERLRLCARGLGIDLDALAADGWIYMSPPDMALQLDVPASAAQLDRAVELFDPGLIVVDNLAKAHGGDENNAAAIVAAMSKLEALARKRSVVLLAHVEKKGGDLRGSTAIRNSAGHVLKLVAGSEANGATITLSTGKARLGGSEPIKFRIVGDRRRQDPIVFETVGDEPKASKGSDRRAHMVELLAEPRSKDEVYDAVGGRRADAVKLFTALVDDGLVSEVEAGRWKLTAEPA